MEQSVTRCSKWRLTRADGDTPGRHRTADADKVADGRVSTLSSWYASFFSRLLTC